jgi:hypothetical protein
MDCIASFYVVKSLLLEIMLPKTQHKFVLDIAGNFYVLRRMDFLSGLFVPERHRIQYLVL